MQRTTLSVSFRAETMITGTLRISGSDFIRFSTSNPFIPGIMRSNSTRSNVSRSSMSSAVLPSAAVATLWPLLVRRRESRSRLASMSSTTRIRPVSSLSVDSSTCSMLSISCDIEASASLV